MRKRFFGKYLGYSYYYGGGDGNPSITTDYDGNIIGYETNEVLDFVGSNNIETNYYINEEDDFELFVSGTFGSSTTRFGTLINAMDETDSSYPGFCIRKSSGGQWKIYYGAYSTAVSITNPTDFQIKITKPANSRTATVTWLNSITQQETTFTIIMTFSSRTKIILGSSVDGSGNYQRYAIATVTKFYIKKSI